MLTGLFGFVTIVHFVSCCFSLLQEKLDPKKGRRIYTGMVQGGGGSVHCSTKGDFGTGFCSG